MDWKEREEISVKRLIGNFRDMGIPGRTVMVHCSYKSIGPVENGAQGVVDAMVDAVGKGTLLIPTYDFQTWPHEHYWDVLETSSKMGIITEFARKDSRFYRTSHPICSYATYNGGFYVVDTPHCMGPESIFEKFIEEDGLLVSIGGLDESNPGFDKGNVGFTQMHHSEMVSGACNYRLLKTFGGVYMGYSREPELRSYTMWVKKAGYRTAVSRAMQMLENMRIIKKFPTGHGVSHVGNAVLVHYATMEMCKNEPYLLREVL